MSFGCWSCCCGRWIDEPAEARAQAVVLRARKKSARQARGPIVIQLRPGRTKPKPAKKRIDHTIPIIAARLAALEETIPGARPLVTWSGAR